MPIKNIQLDRGNEIAILSAVVLADDPESVTPIIRRIPEQEFLVPQHQIVWSVIRESVNRKMWRDHTWIARRLETQDAKIAQFYARLRTDGVLPENLEQKLDTLAWDAKRSRVFGSSLQELIDCIASATADPARTQALATRVSSGLQHHGSEIVAGTQLATLYNASLRERMERGQGVWGLDLPGFDQHLGLGFAPGGTSVVAGVSGAGKTSVLLCWAIRFALQGRRVAYFALEESTVTLLDSLVSAYTAYRYQEAQKTGRPCREPLLAAKLAQGDISAEERKRAGAIVGELSKNIVFIENPFTKKMMEEKKSTNIENVLIMAGLAAEAGADVVIYDLWERALSQGRPFEVEKALELSQGLHKDLGIHGIIAAQINIKNMEKGGNYEAARGDVKGVSKLIEIAYQLFMISRPGMFSGGKDVTTKIDIMKQKNGPWPRHTIWDWDGVHKYVSNPRLERRGAVDGAEDFMTDVGPSGLDEFI